MPLLDILLLILVVAAIILIGYTFSWMKRIEGCVFNMQRDIKEMKDKTVPVLENLDKITSDAVKISQSASDRVNEVTGLVANVKEKFEWLTHPVRRSAESEPGLGLISQLRAISKGIGAFISRIK